VNLIGRGGLNCEINGNILKGDVSSFQGNEMESFDLTINSHSSINSSNSNMNFISSWNFFENLLSETINFINMNGVNVKLIKECFIMEVWFKGLSIKHH